MTKIKLFGLPASSYVRTARWTCEEKGVEHTLEPIEPGSPAHLAVHPYAKMPAMQHGDIKLYETVAICRYIDEAFDGPALQPTDPVQRAKMTQWISVLDSYIYSHFVPNYLFQYIFAKGEPDRAKIEAAVPSLQKDIGLLETELAGRDWLVGDTITLADIFVAPIIAGTSTFPETAAILENSPNVQRFLKNAMGSKGWKVVQPPK